MKLFIASVKYAKKKKKKKTELKISKVLGRVSTKKY